MSDYQQLATSYLDLWNETDPQRRGELIRAVCRDDVSYVDPLADVHGTQALADVVAAAQQQFPGWRFRQTGPVDGHHAQVRFTWDLGPDDASAPVGGFDVLVLDGDGRVRHVYGFLDRVPA